MPSVRFARKVIMFCDLHNFSKVLSLLGDGYPAFIQKYYQSVGNCVVGSGGQVIKYIGDAILSVFKAGTELDAIECAQKIRGNYAKMYTSRNLKVPSEVEIGIGAGTVSIGIFGHSSLKMLDIFGKAVNETAMTMHYRGIALTEAAFRNVSDVVRAEELPHKKVKWQKDPLRVWKVISV